MGIVGAAQYAADVSGVSPETIRRWATTYFLSLQHVSPDNIDNEAVHELMSSERGRTAPHSLLHDEKLTRSKGLCKEKWLHTW